ncbi:hypothetical protein KST80_02275 [Fusobacterium polymorphum]|jgi:hypothetical protein|uniref:hypothetical protein n=1 Tax=Fusobacterium nucleatum subsp. polymorphum TaxID=76857 RepID=UPI000BFCB1A8|nr:hypothetical protein [Fusobacterium polymorphum]PHI12013.1 hypothetical protein CBG58_09480 [Fusobacterium polymorphum]
MDRLEMEKEIEDNIKGIGYKNDDNSLSEEGQILKNIYSTELKLDTSLTQNEKYKEDLISLYINRIENENINVNFQKDKIRTLISTVSFTKINDNILDELPIEKSLRIFNNIKNIYLFHTKAATEYYLKIKEKLTKKGYKVIGEEIDETLTEIRKYLHKILREELNKDEIIVDITAGIKISSISMYKFAVENGIRAINWKEIQLPRYKNNYEKDERTDRIVFSTKLEILKEAMEESRQILTDINESLDREEYLTLARYYNKLDRKDEAFFFEKLAKVFNFETFLALDPDNFYEKVKLFLDEILSYKYFDKNINEKIKSFILLLKIISDTDEEGTFSQKFLSQDEDSDFMRNYYKEEMKSFKITDEDFIDYSLLTENEEDITFKKRELYFYLVLKFLERKYSNTNLKENILDSIKEKILENLKTSELEKIKISFKIFYENLFEKYNTDLKDILNLFDIKEKFKEILTKPATFLDKNTFRIEDYNIEINFLKDKEFEREKKDKKTNKIVSIAKVNEKFFKEMLKVLVDKYSVKRSELEKMEYFKEHVDKTKNSTFDTKTSGFRDFSRRLNEAIRRKIGQEVDDFIIIEDLKDDVLYKINEKFL